MSKNIEKMEVVILKKKIYKGGVAHGKEVNGNGKYAFFIFSAIANGEGFERLNILCT